MRLTGDFFFLDTYSICCVAVVVNFSVFGRVACCVVWGLFATRRWLCFGVVCGMIGVSKKGGGYDGNCNYYQDYP